MRIIAVFLLFFSYPQVWAKDPSEQEVFGSRPGYLFEVNEEKNRRDVEMVMLERPKPGPAPVKELIFNEKLSREFQQQYEYRFGQTQAEQAINSSDRSQDGYSYFTGRNVTVQEYRQEQKRFAEYMGRRLTEFHFDHWAKNDRNFKPVYQAKDRISNLNVKVKSGYQLKWKYNFSGPSMDAWLENPYEIEAKVRTEMSGIVSSPDEYIYRLGYPVTNRVKVSLLHRQLDGVTQLLCTRRMTKRLSTSVSASVDRKTAGPTVKQDLFLVGLSWNE